MRRLLIAGSLAAIIAGLAVVTVHAYAGQHCSQACVQRVVNKHRRAVIRPYLAWLRSTAQCESGGDWHINTGNGFYGGLQFTLQSWQAVGGHGLPSDAGKLEQEYRAILLRRIQGVGAWPVCGV